MSAEVLGNVGIVLIVPTDMFTAIFSNIVIVSVDILHVSGSQFGTDCVCEHVVSTVLTVLEDLFLVVSV